MRTKFIAFRTASETAAEAERAKLNSETPHSFGAKPIS